MSLLLPLNWDYGTEDSFYEELFHNGSYCFDCQLTYIFPLPPAAAK